MDPFFCCSLDRDECEENDCNFKKIGLLFMSAENAIKVSFFPLDGFICLVLRELFLSAKKRFLLII